MTCDHIYLDAYSGVRMKLKLGAQVFALLSVVIERDHFLSNSDAGIDFVIIAIQL